MKQAEKDVTDPDQKARDAQIELCRKLFDAHPEDVISPIEFAADALLWLEEILSIIAADAKDIHARGAHRINCLAEAGKHIASDLGNYASGRHEEMMTLLRQAGAVPAESEAP